MAQALSLIARFEDQASKGLDRLADTLNRLTGQGSAALQQLSGQSAATQAVLVRLGDTTSQVAQRLSFQEAAARAAQDVQTLKAAVKDGLLSQTEFQEKLKAVAANLEALRRQGALRLVGRFEDQASGPLQGLQATLLGVTTQGGTALRDFAGVAGQTRGVLSGLGGDFSATAAKLNFAEASAKAVADIHTLRKALDLGVISSATFGAATQRIAADLQRLKTGGDVVDRFGASLQALVKAGLEPVARVSPTAAAGVERLLLSVGRGGLVFGATVGAAVVFGAGLTKIATGTADAVKRIDQLTAHTGIGQDLIESFGRIARESGEELDQLVRPLGRLNQMIAEVNKGNFSAVEGNFKTLGLSLTTLVSQGLSTDQILEVIGRRLVAIQDPQRRAAALQDLFTSRSVALTKALVALGTEGLDGFTARMREAGAVTSTATRQMGRAITELQNQVGAEVETITKTVQRDVSLIFLELVALARRAKDSVATALSGGFFPDSLTKDLEILTKFGGEFERVVEDVRKRSEASYRIRVGLEGDEVQSTQVLRDLLAGGAAAASPAVQAEVQKILATVAQQKVKLGIEVGGDPLLARIHTLNAERVQLAQDTHRQLQAIEAAAAGDRAQVIALDLQRARAGADAERTARLAAIPSNQDWQLAAAERLKIDSEHLGKVVLAEAQAADARLQLRRELDAELAASGQTRLDAESASRVTELQLTAETEARRASLLGRSGEEAGRVAGLRIQAEEATAAHAIQSLEAQQVATEKSIRERHGASVEADQLIADSRASTAATIEGTEATLAATVTALRENAAEAGRQAELTRLDTALEIASKLAAAEAELAEARAGTADKTLAAEAALAAAQAAHIREVGDAQAQREADYLRSIGKTAAAERVAAEARLRGEGEALEASRVAAEAKIQGIERGLEAERQRSQVTIENLAWELEAEQRKLGLAKTDEERARIQGTIASLQTRIAAEEERFHGAVVEANGQLTLQQVEMSKLSDLAAHLVGSVSRIPDHIALAARESARLTEEFNRTVNAIRGALAPIGGLREQLGALKRSLGEVGGTAAEDQPIREVEARLAEAEARGDETQVRQLQAQLEQLELAREASQRRKQATQERARIRDAIDQVKAQIGRAQLQAFGVAQASLQSQLNAGQGFAPRFTGSAQHGRYLAPGTGNARGEVSVLAHEGELIVPRDLTARLAGLLGRRGGHAAGGAGTAPSRRERQERALARQARHGGVALPEWVAGQLRALMGRRGEGGHYQRGGRVHAGVVPPELRGAAEAGGVEIETLIRDFRAVTIHAPLSVQVHQPQVASFREAADLGRRVAVEQAEQLRRAGRG